MMHDNLTYSSAYIEHSWWKFTPCSSENDRPSALLVGSSKQLLTGKCVWQNPAYKKPKSRGSSGTREKHRLLTLRFLVTTSGIEILLLIDYKLYPALSTYIGFRWKFCASITSHTMFWKKDGLIARVFLATAQQLHWVAECMFFLALNLILVQIPPYAVWYRFSNEFVLCP